MVISCNFIDTVLGSALMPLSVNMILLTVMGAISPLLSTFTLTGAFTLLGATYAIYNLTSCVFSHNLIYWYEICNVLVPIFHVLRGIGTNSSQCEIYEV